MSAYVQLASLRWLLRHRAQLAAAIAGVGLGLACVVGVELAARSALAAFDRSTRALAGRATHALVAGPDGIDEREYARLVRELPELDLAPIFEREARVADLALVLTGVDPLAEARRGGAELAAELGASGARGVWLARAAAQRLGLAPGDDFELTTAGRAARATLAGLLDAAQPAAALALERRALADVAVAQELAGAFGRLSRIDVAAREGRGLAELRARLPAGTTLVSLDARAGELARLSRALRFNLRALALLALVVGVFLAYDGATFAVLQRRELFGRLRALGLERRALFRAVACEALWIGLAGSALGIAVGVALARRLVEPLARTLTDLYAPLAAPPLDVSPAFLAAAAALGVGASLAGSLVPALEAASSPPRVVLARSCAEDRARSLARPLAWIALALAAAALGALALARESLLVAIGALFLLFAAAAAGAPAATALCGRAAALLAARLGGPLARLAARTVEAALSRTAVAVAALAIALGASAAMGVMIASFRATLDGWLDRTLVGDVFVSAPHAVASRSDGRLHPALVAALRALDGVEQVATVRGVELPDGDSTLLLAAVEEPERGRAGYRFVAGDPERAWRELDDGGVFVSEALARARGIGLGAALEIATRTGPVEARVAGVFQDYSTDRGYALVARATYERWFADREVSGMSLFLAPGVDPERVAARIRAELAPDPAIGVRSNAGLRAATLTVFDRTFAVARAVEAFATAIAALACLSSLAALELERARELALLRAEGLGPAGVARLVLGRSLLVGAIAAALALPLGLALSAILVHEVQPRAFGWTLQWSAEPLAAARVAALALGAALCAGLVCAWRAARAPAARALTEE